MYKLSLFCSLGNLINALLLFWLDVVYEILFLLQTLLASLAKQPPGIVITVQIPTFQAATADAQVALCQLGSIIGSIFPLSFSCSAQTNQPVPPPTVTFPAPAIQVLGQHPPVVPAAERFTGFCTYGLAEWAATPPGPCNCNSTQYFFNSSSATCLVDCLEPGVPFPALVGARALNLLFNATTAIRTTFSTATTLRAYLQSCLAAYNTSSGPALTGFNVAPATDPSDATSFAPSGLLCQLVPALLNWGLQSLYNPGEELGVVLPNVIGVYVSDYVDLMNRFIYGGAETTLTANAADSFWQQTLIQGAGYNAWVLGNSLNAWAIAHNYTWVQQVEVMLKGLQLYNDAYPNCTTGASAQCFLTAQTLFPSDTPQPWIDTPLSTNITGATLNVTVATWQPVDYSIVLTNVTAQCIYCSTPWVYYYNNVPGVRNSTIAAACLLACDGPRFPYLMGLRRADCLVPGFCAAYSGADMTSITGVQTILNYGYPTFTNNSENGNTFNQPAIDNSLTGALAGQLLAAKFNLAYIARYIPGQAVFVRGLSDPLFSTTSCISNTVDRQFLAGRLMDDIVRLIEVMHYADLNDNRDCLAHFSSNTTIFSVCTFWVMSYGLQQPPQLTGLYPANTSLHFLPILQLFNSFAPPYANSSVTGNSCFVTGSVLTGDQLNFWSNLNNLNNVTINPALPPLDFVSVLFKTLPNENVATITPCGSTIECLDFTFCSAALVLGSPFILVSNVLLDLHNAVADGSSAWTLGTDFWSIVGNVLITITQNLGAFVLDALSSLDCFLCAIGGNDRSSPLCTNPLFNVFQPIVVLLQSSLALIINFAVMTAQLIVNVIYYFFTAQFAQLFEAIFTWFLNFFLDLIVPLIESIIVFIFGAICSCGFWKLFFSDIATCTNMQYCGGKKRSLADMAFDILATSTAGSQWQYQMFAPDWPALDSYASAWPVSQPCHTRMEELAPLAPTQLTQAQANEAAYCLGAVLLYNISGSQPATVAAPTLYGLDACEQLMRELWIEQRAFSAMSSVERAAVTSCINDRAIMGGIRRSANGHADWLPVTLLSTSGGGHALVTGALRTGMDLLKAATTHAQRRRDTSVYPRQVLASVDYRATLAQAYGTPRAALVEQALVGQPGSMLDYAKAIHQPSPALKRQGQPPPLSDQHVERVARIADTLGAAFGEMHTTLLPDWQARVDTLAAALPPPIMTYGTSDGAPGALTPDAQAVINEEGGMVVSSDALDSHFHTGLDRLRNTAWRLFRLSQTASSNTGPIVAATKKRDITLPNGTRVSGVTLLTQAMHHGVALAKEVWSGRAHANATGVPHPRGLNSTTLVQWETTSPKNGRARYHGYASRRGGGGGGTGMGTAAAAITSSPGIQRTGVTKVVINGPGYYARQRSSFWGASMTARAAQWAHGNKAFYSMVGRARDTSHKIVSLAVANGAAERNLIWHPYEMGRRLTLVRSEIARVWGMRHSSPYLSTAALVRASSATNGTGCFTTQELCTQCYVIDQFVGYLTAELTRLVDTVTSSSPQYWNNLNYLYSQYQSVEQYLTNTSIPARFGNSPNLPVRFPCLTCNNWDYLGTPLPTIGFSDLSALWNATWAFLETLLPSLSDPAAFFHKIFGFAQLPNGTAPSSPLANATKLAEAAEAISRPLFESDTPMDESLMRLMHVDDASRTYMDAYYPQALAAWNANPSPLVPRPLRTQEQILPIFLPTAIKITTRVLALPVAMARAWIHYGPGQASIAEVPPPRIADIAPSGPFNTTGQVIVAWIDWVFFQFLSCNYGSDLDGTAMRASFVLSFLIAIVPGLIVTVILQQAIPFLGAIGALYWGMIAPFAIIVVAYSLASGWSLFCMAAQPQARIFHKNFDPGGLISVQVLFSNMIMQQVTEVILPQCIIFYNGLINEANFTKDKCRICANWQSGGWTYADPIKDLGWTSPVDFIVFPLQQWAPDYLAFLADPNNFAFPLNLLIASSFWQNWVTRWKNVNIRANEIIFSQQWSAWAWVTPFELLILQFAGQLFAFAPALSSLRVALSVALFLIAAAAMLAMGGFMLVYISLTLPDSLRQRALSLLAYHKQQEQLARLQRREQRRRAKQQAAMEAQYMAAWLHHQQRQVQLEETVAQLAKMAGLHPPY